MRRSCEARTRAADTRHQRRVDRCEAVPVGPIRRRFEQMERTGEISIADLCNYMGWVTRLSDERCKAERRRPGYCRPQTAFARRVLGQRGECFDRKIGFVNYDTAVRLCQALGMDPWEAGV